ncbi:hypothetical protein [Maricaulis sp. CAU 1757]
MISLPDWAFFPVAAALAAGMVLGALSFGESNQRSTAEIFAEGVSYSGPDLAQITLGNGLSAEFLSQNERDFVRITAERGPFDGIQSAGAFYTLAPEELRALQGHRVDIRVVMRQPDENAADGVRIAFFVPGIGQDAWDRREISGEFEAYDKDVAAPSCAWDYGYIGVWPDWRSGQNRADIQSIEITALEPLEC